MTTSTSELAISTRGLRKTYRNRRGVQVAVAGLDLDVPVGGVHGFLGPNGSGKTTSIRMLLGLVRADSGTMRIFNHEVPKHLPEVVGRVGAIVESPKFFPSFSGRKNLQLLAEAIGRPRGIVDQVLEQTSLGERGRDKYRTYSLGMKQRLAIAAALLGDPQILVLDEPTNGLDPVGIMEIRELIIELSKKGHTIIMASHLLDEVEKVCTHVAILKTGTLVTSGSVEDVLVDEDVIEVAAANMEQLKHILSDYPGITTVINSGQTLQIHFAKGTARPDEINQYCFSKGVSLQLLLIKKKRLEEKFFELTNN